MGSLNTGVVTPAPTPAPIERKTRLDALAMGILVACCAFWGFQQILIKATVGEVPPLWQAGLRFAGATALLMLWCAWRGIALFERDGSLWPGLLTGALFAGEFCLIYLGMPMTTASRLTVFVYVGPLVVALLLPWVVPGETSTGKQRWGLVLAFSSVVVAFSSRLFVSSAAAPPLQHWGDLMALGAGLMWGMSTVAIRGTSLGSKSPEKVLFYQIGITAVVALPLSALLGETWRWDYTTQAWASIALQTVVGAFASYLAWMWLLRHYPATKLSSFVFLTPLFALVLGVFMLSEPLSLELLLALAGVAGGIVLVNRR